MSQGQNRFNSYSVVSISIPEKIRESIQMVSNNGDYQKNLIIYFLLTAFFTNLPIISSNLFYMNPAFSCQGMEGKIAEDVACNSMQFCTISNSQLIQLTRKPSLPSSTSTADPGRTLALSSKRP
jgi:hypothetical protein